MSTEENMDTNNAEIVSEQPVDTETPTEVSLALDVYFGLTINNKFLTIIFPAKRTRRREAGGGEVKGQISTSHGRIRKTRRTFSIPSEKITERSKVLRFR